MSKFSKSAAFPILIVVILALLRPAADQRAQPEEGPRLRRLHAAAREGSGQVRRDAQPQQRAAGHARRQEPVPRRLRHRLRRQADRAAAEGRADRQDPGVHRQGHAHQRLDHDADLRAAVPAVHRLLDLPHEPDAGRRLEGHVVRQVARQADVGRLAEDHLPRRRGRRRGGRGAARDQGVPREPEEVPGARRADPEGRAALRTSRHRQDAARARRRRRGRRAVLLDLRLGLRRDVRRRRRLAACATSSSRPSRTAPASSSWTRSTPSAAIAAPAWAAVTTSASRRSTSCSSRWTASR